MAAVALGALPRVVMPGALFDHPYGDSPCVTIRTRHPRPSVPSVAAAEALRTTGQACDFAFEVDAGRALAAGPTGAATATAASGPTSTTGTAATHDCL